MLPVDVLGSVPSSNDGFNQLLAKQILAISGHRLGMGFLSLPSINLR